MEVGEGIWMLHVGVGGGCSIPCLLLGMGNGCGISCLPLYTRVYLVDATMVVRTLLSLQVQFWVISQTYL